MCVCIVCVCCVCVKVMADEVKHVKQQLNTLKRAHQEAQDALCKSEGEKARVQTEIAQLLARDYPRNKSKLEHEKSEGEIGFLNRQNERLLQQVSFMQYIYPNDHKHVFVFFFLKRLFQAPT